MLLCRNIFFFDTPVVDSDVGMLTGMSEYYGSEGFDRPPSDVYSSFGGFVFDEGGYFEGGYEGGSFGDDGLGRERPSPWYNVDCVFVCVCVCALE